MRRRAAKLDANQVAIVEALRRVPGLSAQSLAACGKGVPDLLIGWEGRNYLLEVKNPNARAGRLRGKIQAATDARQIEFHRTWNGQIAKVETLDEIFAILGILPFRAPGA